MATSKSTTPFVEISISRSQVTLVDECDVDLMTPRWQALPYKKSVSKFRVSRKRHITSVGLRTEYLHRLILERVLGRPLLSIEEVDHINRDGLDNRRENLRLVTRSINMHNTDKRIDSKQPYKGVRKRGNRWQARISINKRSFSLGFFSTPEEARFCYEKAKQEIFL